MAQFVFLDTWGYLALYDTRELRHREVKQYLAALLPTQRLIVTNFVLDETISLLFRRVPFTQAKAALETIRKSIVQGYVLAEEITPSRFDAAIDLRLKFDDKPDISFTDLTSFIVMRELGIQQVITGDEHFEHVGMGFTRIP